MKNRLIFLLGIGGVLLSFSGLSFAQSTLEYSILTSGQGALGAKNVKDKKSAQGQEAAAEGQNSVAGAASNVIQQGVDAALTRGSTLLGQAGAGLHGPQAALLKKPAETVSSPAPEVSDQGSTQKTDKKPEKPAADEENSSLDKVYLRSGQVISGTLVEQNDQSVKLNTEGVVVTYFPQEVEKVVSGRAKQEGAR
jgi:hypothetical protein